MERSTQINMYVHLSNKQDGENCPVKSKCGKKGNTAFSFTAHDDNFLSNNDLSTQAGIEDLSTIENKEKHWYAMRDLKRTNARFPAYKLLEQIGVEFFTPMHWRLTVKGNKRIREKVPFIQDLIFVFDTREKIDAIVLKTPTLQYRYQKGKPFREPMTVPDNDMWRFIRAVAGSDNPKYYRPDEITPAMYGHKIRIVGGNLDGYEGRLLNVRGSRVKRILIELPNWLAATVEISPEYIQL